MRQTPNAVDTGFLNDTGHGTTQGTSDLASCGMNRSHGATPPPPERHPRSLEKAPGLSALLVPEGPLRGTPGRRSWNPPRVVTSLACSSCWMEASSSRDRTERASQESRVSAGLGSGAGGASPPPSSSGSHPGVPSRQPLWKGLKRAIGPTDTAKHRPGGRTRAQWRCGRTEERIHRWFRCSRVPQAEIAE